MVRFMVRLIRLIGLFKPSPMIMAEQPGNAEKITRRGAAYQKPAPSFSTERIGAPKITEKEAGSVGEALRRSELKNRALLSTIADLIFYVRKDGTILDFQAPRHNEYMLTPESVVGRRIMELLPTQIGQQAMHYVEKTLRLGTVQVFSCQFLLPGRLRDFEARIAVCGPDEVLALVRDVTDRKLLEKEVLEISTREQIRIGQDLHDGLGQHLTGISFLSKALERKLAALSREEAADAAEIGKLVLQALSQTRNLTRGIFPVELEATGLIPAFRELAATVSKLFNISCTFECDEALAINNRDLATHLFRLAQEAINNSVKHGKARQVILGLKELEDRAVLTITDDGVGLPQEATKMKGLGVRIMQYRAQKIGAALDIRSGEKKGTVVSCLFSNTSEEQ